VLEDPGGSQPLDCPASRRRPTTDTTFHDLDVSLRDGRAVHIRAVRPEDEAELVQAFGRMSEEARYMRFMGSVGELDLDRLRETLAAFPESGLGIVATVPADDGIDIVGSAVYFVGRDRTRCEFAITVASRFGGAGLATTLMNALIDAAKRRGMGEMDGFVLAANTPMLRLARRLGFSVAPDPDDASVRICRLRLGPQGAQPLDG
jgi:RimJ/RimL family protein N-acetyltransferase